MWQKQLLGLSVVVSLALGTAVAQETQPTTQPVFHKAGVALASGEKLAVTQHEITIGGKKVAFTATAGYQPLKDEAGKVKANFFYTAYEVKPPAEATGPNLRPVTFVFNGGPGAASVWLHLGTVGPWKIALPAEGTAPVPPYQLVENPDSWLGATDLVLIDPIGTGYSRAAAGEDARKFYGVQEDIQAVGEFIRGYLTRQQRMTAPLYLAGESYGTTRAVGLAEHLLNERGIRVSGLILISTVLDFKTISVDANNDWPHVLYLPTYTALAAYHGKLDAGLTRDLPGTLTRAETFALETYLPALARGAALEPARRNRVLDELALLTGMPRATLDRNDLRLSAPRFQQQLLGDKQLVLGRFDGRMTAAAQDPGASGSQQDPSLSAFLPPYTQTFNDYVRRTLRYENDLTYEVLSSRVHPWSGVPRGLSGGYLYVGDELRTLLISAPETRVLVVSGRHDLATPYFATQYTLDQLRLPAERRGQVRHVVLDGGHMMYHKQENLPAVRAAVEGLLGEVKR